MNTNQNLNGKHTLPIRFHHLDADDRADLAEALTEAPLPLTPNERDNFKARKLLIHRGLKTFIEVGEALADIRDARLYREEFDTFENFCKAEFGMAARYARRIIQAADIANRLSHAPEGGNESNWPALALPATESQTRPLAALPPEEQRDAWAEAVQTAPDGVVTARHVQAIVNRRLGKPDLDTGQKTGIPSEKPRGTAAPLPGLATTPAAGQPVPATPAPPIDVKSLGTPEEEKRHDLEKILAGILDYKNKYGASDSVAAAAITIAEKTLDAAIQQLERVEQFQQARA
jgi:hypothetical protein